MDNKQVLYVNEYTIASTHNFMSTTLLLSSMHREMLEYKRLV